MYARIAALVSAFAIALTVLVGVPAATENSAAHAIGETVSVTKNSNISITVTVITNTGKTTKLTILPGGWSTTTARFDSWRLPPWSCAMFAVNGKYEQLRCTETWGSSIWIPPGGSVAINAWKR